MPLLHWRAIAASVRGASHEAIGLPNQDACEVASPNDDVLIAAVADGHGAPLHFRSGDGSVLATECAVSVLRDALPRLRGCSDEGRDRFVREAFAAQLVAAWLERVHEALALGPISDAELRTLRQAAGASAVELVRDEPVLAYGTTLIAALATPSFVALWQLGDGEAAVVRADGSRERPIASDARLDGTLTTSLCIAGAERDFRSVLLEDGAAAVATVVLCTDGYSNAFADERSLLDAVGLLHARVASEGLDRLAERLPELVQTASDGASGDDATLVLLSAAAPLEPASQGPSEPATAAADTAQRRAVPAAPAGAVARADAGASGERLVGAAADGGAGPAAGRRSPRGATGWLLAAVALAAFVAWALAG